MQNVEDVTPSTITGIKRLATRIKKSDGVKLATAQNMAAVRAGYRDFREAKRGLANTESTGVPVRLTAHYSDAGRRRTLVTHVYLTQDLRQFLRPRDIRECIRIGRYELRALDHLEGWHGREDERIVKQAMAKAARALQFMDATGLKPSRASIFGRGRYEFHVPGQDHSTTWRDPETRRLVMLDEPYAYSDEMAERRRAWAEQNGYEMHRLEWGGTYFPEGQAVCDIVSHAENGVPAGDIVARMAKAGPVFTDETGDWVFHEGAFTEPSPGELAEAAAKAQAKAKRIPATKAAPGRAGASVTYGRGEKRPNGTLSLDRHAEIGMLLMRARIVVLERQGARSAIELLRSLLENWANAERGGTISNEDLYPLYYGDVPDSSEILARLTYGKPDQALKDSTLADLARVRSWLVEGYPDGVGLDRALKLVDKAISSLSGFATRG